MIAAKRQYAGRLLRLLSFHTTSSFSRNLPRFAFGDSLSLGSRLPFSLLGIYLLDLCGRRGGLSFMGRLWLGFRLGNSRVGRPDGRRRRSGQDYPGGSRRLRTCARLRRLVMERGSGKHDAATKADGEDGERGCNPCEKDACARGHGRSPKCMTSERTARQIGFPLIKILATRAADFSGVNLRCLIGKNRKLSDTACVVTSDPTVWKLEHGR
jgi:hypothetical protein